MCQSHQKLRRNCRSSLTSRAEWCQSPDKRCGATVVPCSFNTRGMAHLSRLALPLGDMKNVKKWQGKTNVFQSPHVIWPSPKNQVYHGGSRIAFQCDVTLILSVTQSSLTEKHRLSKRCFMKNKKHEKFNGDLSRWGPARF